MDWTHESEQSVKQLLCLCAQIKEEHEQCPMDASSLEIQAQQIRHAFETKKDTSVVLHSLANTIQFITEDAKLVYWFVSTCCDMLRDDVTSCVDRDQLNLQVMYQYCANQVNFRTVDEERFVKTFYTCAAEEQAGFVRCAIRRGNIDVVRILIQSGYVRWGMFVDSSLHRMTLRNLIIEDKMALEDSPIWFNSTVQPGHMMAWILAVGESQLLTKYGPSVNRVPQLSNIHKWENELEVQSVLSSECVQNEPNVLHDCHIITVRKHVKQECSCPTHTDGSDESQLQVLPGFPYSYLEMGQCIRVNESPCFTYLKAICVAVLHRKFAMVRRMCQRVSHGWKQQPRDYGEDASYRTQHLGIDLHLPLIVAACLGDFDMVRCVLFCLPPILDLTSYGRTSNIIGSHAAFCGQIAMATAFSRFCSFGSAAISTAYASRGDYHNAFLTILPVEVDRVTPQNEREQFNLNWRNVTTKVEVNRYECWWKILNIASGKGHLDILTVELPQLLAHLEHNEQRAKYYNSQGLCEGDWSVKHLLSTAIQAGSTECAAYLSAQMEDEFASSRYCQSLLIHNGADEAMVKALMSQQFSPHEFLQLAMNEFHHQSLWITNVSFIGALKVAFDKLKESNDEKQIMSIAKSCFSSTAFIAHRHCDHKEDGKSGSCNIADVLDFLIEILGRDSIKRSTIRNLMKNKHCVSVARVLTSFIKSSEFINYLIADQVSILRSKGSQAHSSNSVFAYPGALLYLYGIGGDLVSSLPPLNDSQMTFVYGYGRHKQEQWGALWCRVQFLAEGLSVVQDTVQSDDVMNVIHSYLV